jgi:error-prone DNA polymerase
VGVLARQPAPARSAVSRALDLFAGDGASAEEADGMADLVPAGQLRDLDVAERVAAELEILGFDLSKHVLDFYTDLLSGLNVVRSSDLDTRKNGETVLVAGVKVATQTPAVRSGQRIIFASLDDAAGLVDLAFFESVQDRCAARLFGSWLLLVRGKVRRAGAGPLAVTVNATECWDIPTLDEIRLSQGISAVHAAMAAGDVGPGAHLATLPLDALDTVDPLDPLDAVDPLDVNNLDINNLPTKYATAASRNAGQQRNGIGKPMDRALVFDNGFVLSPYAETGGPGGNPKNPPRTLWHASPGSTHTPN